MTRALSYRRRHTRFALALMSAALTFAPTLVSAHTVVAASSSDAARGAEVSRERPADERAVVAQRRKKTKRARRAKTRLAPETSADSAQSTSALLPKPDLGGATASAPPEAESTWSSLERSLVQSPEWAPGAVRREVAAPSPSPGPTSNRPAFVLRAGLELGARRFSYNQPVTSNLRSYSLALAPLAAVAAEAYPFATTGLTLLRDLGWSASFARSLRVESQFQDDAGDRTTVASVWQQWHVGALARVALAPSTSLRVSAALTHLSYDFALAEDDARTAELPSVRYSAARGGLELRHAMSLLELSASGAYLHVLSGGSVGNDYFPRSAVAGVEAGLGASVAVSGALALEISARYTRFFYDMRPKPGDPYVAGGALDQYLSGALRLVYALGSG